jgi:hypothetical protein
VEDLQPKSESRILTISVAPTILLTSGLMRMLKQCVYGLDAGNKAVKVQTAMAIIAN